MPERPSATLEEHRLGATEIVQLRPLVQSLRVSYRFVRAEISTSAMGDRHWSIECAREGASRTTRPSKPMIATKLMMGRNMGFTFCSISSII
jgi:hypothetical protein